MLRQRIIKNNRMVGLMLADVNSKNEVVFAYSLETDQNLFDKKMASTIATGRLKKALQRNKEFIVIPFAIKKDVKKFFNRVQRYFKGAELPAIDF